MLGKAACFEVPILTSASHLMGERVRRYGIGYGIQDNDAAEILAALDRVVSNPVCLEKFAAYRKDFNEETLSRGLESLIQRVVIGKKMQRADARRGRKPDVY